EEKVRIAASLLLESPPGELNDVFNDLRVLVNDDDALLKDILPKLFEYHTEQFSTAALPGSSSERPIVISKHAIHPSFLPAVSDGEQESGENLTHFIDFNTNQVFEFDHLRQEVVAVEPLGDNEGESLASIYDAGALSLRSAIDTAAAKYVNDAYPEGAVGTYVSRDSSSIVIAIVGNKYNPSNFWNGRWRTEWTYDINSGDLRGAIKVNVHYYEDGNVQLCTQRDIEPSPELAVPRTTADGSKLTDEEIAATIVRRMKIIEDKFQAALSEAYVQLSESTFKGLRRILPVTRTRMNWEKTIGYKVGGAL
ncbi:subunits of heterodimeric actin filament capping protein Capz, partial [Ramicandelaber brevisporus]